MVGSYLAMKVRRKPIEMEAILWDGSENARQRLMEWVPWQISWIDDGVPRIHTLEGVMTVSVGDYIVKGTQGEFWAIKPAAFAATYDVVEGEQ